MTTKTLRLLGAITVLACSAWADDGNGDNSMLQSSVIGTNPGLAAGGVNSGGAPWVVKEGHASITPGGRIQVEVHGLLLASTGTTGPVKMVGATLVCGGTGGTPVAVDTISPSPLSSSGDAQIDQTVTLPAPCFGPVLLIRSFNPSAPLGSQLGVFIAMTGLAGGH